MRVVIAATAEAPVHLLAAARLLLDEAFDDFTDHDWDHAVGGTHVFLVDGDMVAAHASVVQRTITFDEVALRAGYVEAVAVQPDRHGAGFGTQVMSAVNDIIDAGYEVGVLATGSPMFYERLGWHVWQGPSHVRTGAGVVPSPDEDGAIMVRLTSASPGVSATAAIGCDERPGDAW